ncbi:fringe-related family protein [Dorcoceras hygrometricum]|uniref:Fringe-related family protein n=1 Tax=Dorcoceras hygrometricum TaxID=472368 RepID=A0A2Z7BFH9_9LAMI|nr:fringe-related family protein [Dorcoceras hygrometricum]
MQYFKREMHEGYQESSVGKAQRLSCPESNPVIFRYDRSVTHHSVVVFRHDNSAGHHINISVGPFRHDGSTGRSQRTNTTTTSADLTGIHGTAAYSNMLLYQLTINSTEDAYKLKFKAAKERKNSRSEFSTVFEHCNHFVLLQHVDSKLQTDINQNS